MARTDRVKLSIRLPKELKAEIVRAAEVSGQTMSDFVVTSLQDVTEHLTILGAEDYDAFLAMLESDRKPSRALRDAVRMGAGMGLLDTFPHGQLAPAGKPFNLLSPQTAYLYTKVGLSQAVG